MTRYDPKATNYSIHIKHSLQNGSMLYGYETVTGIQMDPQGPAFVMNDNSTKTISWVFQDIWNNISNLDQNINNLDTEIANRFNEFEMMKKFIETHFREEWAQFQTFNYMNE